MFISILNEQGIADFVILNTEGSKTNVTAQL